MAEMDGIDWLHVQQRLAAFTDELDSVRTDHMAILADLATAEADWEYAYATAYESTRAEQPKMRLPDLENTAKLAAHDEHRRLLELKAAERATGRAMQALSEIVASYRTLNSNARAEAGWGS